ncbi:MULTISPECIES: VRR-NUC domain-containing protein [Bacillus]|mgnify:CR=1 FL=1|uniref:Nuclease p44 n=1 Tax=Bacillus sonorensis TaxID=119858 RepID=A0ABM6LN69_9BACI|nr:MULTISPECIES: VRR-NUC domain-containing protein [Bacillus]ASB90850.1 Putative nuclease p44 [Bacillus sonorensis]MEC0340057.1 VRR-NUC domain-containing protein [Bacillus sonorensis]MEC0425734.1 VRR-NUC domain-containing protein [Bacillus sonorensis]MEC0458593.1 VRR-NUC domain-containing protein [Bacillus sonorensis]MEC0497384.1 VRR-NUC domain-containing protein [Bacillus glycinifermentans]
MSGMDVFIKGVETVLQESQLERLLKRKVESLGGQALKFVSPGMSGVPDRLVLIPGGRAVFAEMKAPGKNLRPLQEKRKRDLESLGFTVCKLDSRETIDAFIRRFFHEV